MITLQEGGNAIPDSNPVNKEDVAGIVNQVKKLLPPALLGGLHTNIGSAGFKLASGDIDVMVEAEDVVALFKTQDSKDPVKDAKKMLGAYFSAKDTQVKLNGRNVSIGVKYTEAATKQLKLAQVDVMVINDAAIVAPYHQHGPRGMYSDPGFKGASVFILVNSISKALGLKFDAFGGKLLRRDTEQVVARTRDEVANVLFNAKALGRKPTGDDLNSVNTVMTALANDPAREAKLAQARDDQAKGLITLPESIGSAAWFRKLSDSIL